MHGVLTLNSNFIFEKMNQYINNYYISNISIDNTIDELTMKQIAKEYKSNPITTPGCIINNYKFTINDDLFATFKKSNELSIATIKKKESNSMYMIKDQFNNDEYSISSDQVVIPIFKIKTENNIIWKIFNPMQKFVSINVNSNLFTIQQ